MDLAVELRETLDHLRPFISETPILRTKNGIDGLPVQASAFGRIEASQRAVWQALSDVDKYSARVPLIDSVKVQGDRVEVGLKFGMAFFSARFSYQADLKIQEGKALVLTYRNGEPKDMEMSFVVEPDISDPTSCLLGVQIGFDVHSIGWLTRFFLKRHPEIQYGIHPGCALGFFDSMKKAAKEYEPAS